MKKTGIFLLSIIFMSLISCTNQDKDWKPLFNGKTLENWDKYLQPSTEKSEEATGNITPDNVFSIIELDGKKVMRISGEVYGSIASRDSFENYHLRMVFKWGENVTRERNSGLLYHSFGPFGKAFNTWMNSVELQLKHGSLGDAYLITNEVSCEANADENRGQYYYNSLAGKTEFSQQLGRPKIQKMVYAEKPLGEWNTIDLYCLGQTSVHVVNGKTVLINENLSRYDKGVKTPLTKGKIQLQSEGAELFVRSVDIRPISEIPVEVLDNLSSDQ